MTSISTTPIHNGRHNRIISPGGADDMEEAERICIGAPLSGIPTRLMPDDFGGERCRQAARAIAKVHIVDGTPDINEVIDSMAATTGEPPGDVANWLLGCMSRASVDAPGSAATKARIKYYAGVVKDASERRKLLELAENIRNRASDESLHIGESLAYIAERHAELSERQRGGLTPMSVAELIEAHPTLPEPVIDGLFRRGEIVNSIANTKVGKSWGAYGLGLSVANGIPWLGQYPTTQGRVLIVDNELHPSVLSHRIPRVASAMGVPSDGVETIPLRGRLVDIFGLWDVIANVKDRGYSLIILDALYKFLPDGFNENDNAQMARLYNTLDRYAAETGAAIMCIHHSTKGIQSGKRVTDVGAGAGSQSRAADCHLVLREHEDDGCAVLDAAVRSFPPVGSAVLRWEFPLWNVDEDGDPSRLKGLNPKAEKQRDADLEAQGKILDALDDGPKLATEIQDATGFGRDRVRRLIGILKNAGYVEETEVESHGRTRTGYRKTIFARDSRDAF